MGLISPLPLPSTILNMTPKSIELALARVSCADAISRSNLEVIPWKEVGRDPRI